MYGERKQQLSKYKISPGNSMQSDITCEDGIYYWPKIEMLDIMTKWLRKMLNQVLFIIERMEDIKEIKGLKKNALMMMGCMK